MEFRVKTDLSAGALTPIDFNYEELKSGLENNLAQYKGRLVEEGDIPSAKKDLAMLRKLNTAMDAERKRVKSLYLCPYNEFEAKVKELQALVREPIGEISTQIESFEENRKAEKVERLKKFFNEQAGDAAKYITWESIFNERWKNATFQEKDAEAEIIAAIDNCYRDIETIRRIDDTGAYEDILLKKYAHTRNLREVLALYDQLKAATSAAMAIKEGKPEEVAKTPEAHPREPERAVEAAPKQQTGQTRYTVAFSVTGTRKELDELAQFMYKRGIQYKQIKK